MKVPRRRFLRWMAGGLGALAGGRLVGGCKRAPLPTLTLTDQPTVTPTGTPTPTKVATPTATPGRVLTSTPFPHPLVVNSAPPAPPSESIPNLSPASWPKEELNRYATLERTWGSSPHLASGRRGVIVGTSNALAIRAGFEALKQGGSAVDAALVTSLAQIALNAGAAVSYAGVLAMMCYEASTGELHSLNAGYNVPRKETDPLSIPRFEPSGRSALVPGFMAGVQAAHSRFGRLPLETLFEPAIHFAQEGFRISDALAGRIAMNRSVLSRLPEARRIFAREDGELVVEGDWFHQPELAETLRAVAAEGADYMYRGPWATKLVQVVQREGGKMVFDDLAAYEVIWPEPVHDLQRMPSLWSGSACRWRGGCHQGL